MHQNIKNALIHLRLPFSFFLLPVFLFALSQQADPRLWETIILFFVLHLLVYPSSNAYNSYMDQDTGSIGGIETPPKVPDMIFPITLALDFLGMAVTAYCFPIEVTALLLLYILASRAYSYRGIRLKKYPIVGFLTVAIFQGPAIYLLASWGISGEISWEMDILMGAAISFFLIGAGYPLTQVYQHAQDKADGVQTLSLLLGIRGTFIFSGILYALLGIQIGYYFVILKHTWLDAGLFLLLSSPVMFFFATWMRKVFIDPKSADFHHTMRSNQIGAVAINLFFLLLCLKNLL